MKEARYYLSTPAYYHGFSWILIAIINRRRGIEIEISSQMHQLYKTKKGAKAAATWFAKENSLTIEGE